MRTILLALAALTLAAPAEAQVRITIDASLAERTLGLVCSGRPVDERAVRNSPAVQAQIAHNSGLIAAATMDAYVAALRAASACQAPAEDPFGIGDVIANREIYRAKITALTARQNELTQAVAARLAPFMRDGENFEGSVVLAVPYFSCGGFSREAAFFIDIRCLDADISADWVALELLIAHETFHAIQQRYFARVIENAEEIATLTDAYAYLFGALLWEGSAEYATPSRELGAGGGMLTRIGRQFAASNAQRRRSNFNLLSMMFEYVSHHEGDPRAAAERAYQIAFTGTFEQFAYYAGAEMAGDIDQAWGRPALLCVMRLPAEEFALAHDAVAEARTDNPRRLGPAAIGAARAVRATRETTQTFESCRPA
ncbi:MAG: DUF5700 domain-containing putative Zn-dependent protease [Hyphomonadaceae bacterium]